MKTKVNGQSTHPQTDNEISKFDAIKDILFGENIQNYDKQFELLKKDILSKKEELLDVISDTEKEINTAIDNLSTDVNIRITSLEDKLQDRINTLENNKLDKEVLGNLLVKLGEKISK